MKRSEMVEKIMLILRGCYPQHLDNQSNYSVRIDADYILRELEHTGMLPPEIKIEVESTYFQDPNEISYIYDNEWEPEDD